MADRTFTQAAASCGLLTEIDQIRIDAMWGSPIYIGDAATLTLDASRGCTFRTTLGGNRTLLAPLNPSDGQTITFEFQQDDVGNRSVTLATGVDGFSFGTDAPLAAWQLSTTPGAIDIATFKYRSSTQRWMVLGLVRGFGDVTALAIEKILALAAGRPVFTADRYIVDAISGKVAAFVDWNDPTHLLIQTDTTKQVAIPTAHADFGGKLCATFTGLQWYVSNRSALSWSYLHDGTGAEWYVLFTPTSLASARVMGTRNVSGAGAALSFNGTGPAWSAANSTPTVLFSTSQVISNNAPTYVGGRYQSGIDPDYVMRLKSAITGSNPESATPNVAAPETSFSLGARADGTVPASMRFRCVIFSPVLTTSQRTDVQNYMLLDDGIGP